MRTLSVIRNVHTGKLGIWDHPTVRRLRLLTKLSEDDAIRLSEVLKRVAIGGVASGHVFQEDVRHAAEVQYQDGEGNLIP